MGNASLKKMEPAMDHGATDAALAPSHHPEVLSKPKARDADSEGKPEIMQNNTTASFGGTPVDNNWPTNADGVNVRPGRVSEWFTTGLQTWSRSLTFGAVAAGMVLPVLLAGVWQQVTSRPSLCWAFLPRATYEASAASPCWAAVDALLRAEPTLLLQGLEAGLQAVFWFVVIFGLQRVLLSWCSTRPWFDRAVMREAERTKKMLGLELSTDLARNQYCSMVAIGFQHVVSGILACFAVFGLCAPAAAMSLLRHAALSEAGWEISDTVERLYRRYVSPGGDEGRRQQPAKILIFAGVHHLAAMTLAIPMNLYYAHLYHYALLVFLLEFAAGIAVLTAQYVLTLDVKLPAELFQMRIICVITFLAIVPTRGPLFLWSSCSVLNTFYSEGASGFLAVAIAALIGMLLVNILVIMDVSNRMRKFFRPSDEINRIATRVADETPAAASSDGALKVVDRPRRLSAGSEQIAEFSSGLGSWASPSKAASELLSKSTAQPLASADVRDDDADSASSFGASTDDETERLQTGNHGQCDASETLREPAVLLGQLSASAKLAAP